MSDPKIDCDVYRQFEPEIYYQMRTVLNIKLFISLFNYNGEAYCFDILWISDLLKSNYLPNIYDKDFMFT